MNNKWVAIPLGGIIIATAFAAFPAISSTVVTIVTCASTGACVTAINSGTGPGVQGSSRKGNGVYGTTTSATANSGVLGSDITTINTNNVGVKGTSNKGNGVYGTSVSAIGVKGLSRYIGVEGDSSQIGVYGHVGNGGGIGVEGVAQETGVFGDGYIGVDAQSNDANGAAIAAFGGYYGVSANGIQFGVEGSSNNTGVNGYGGQYGVTGNGSTDGVTGANQSGTAGTAVLAQGNAVSGFLFRGNNTNSSDVFTVDDSGNGYFSGQVSAKAFFTHAAAKVAQATSTGAKVATFSTQATEPSVEHVGEANLIGGTATVRFNSDFAATLAHGNFMVFLTPQGPVQGALYVTGKGPGGFMVRESQAGHSTVAFDYRVVGRPYSTQLSAGTDTLRRNTPAGPVHGPAMTKPKFHHFMNNKLPKPAFKALPVIK